MTQLGQPRTAVVLGPGEGLDVSRRNGRDSVLKVTGKDTAGHLAITELAKWANPSVVAASTQAFLATIAEAHAMVAPSMIDYLGLARELSAVPVLLQIAAGEHRPGNAGQQIVVDVALHGRLRRFEIVGARGHLQVFHARFSFAAGAMPPGGIHLF